MKIPPSLLKQMVLVSTTSLLLTAGCNLDLFHSTAPNSPPVKALPANTTTTTTTTTSDPQNTLSEEPKTLETLLLVPPKKEEVTPKEEVIQKEEKKNPPKHEEKPLNDPKEKAACKGTHTGNTKCTECGYCPPCGGG